MKFEYVYKIIKKNNLQEKLEKNERYKIFVRNFVFALQYF